MNGSGCMIFILFAITIAVIIALCVSNGSGFSSLPGMRDWYPWGPPSELTKENPFQELGYSDSGILPVYPGGNSGWPEHSGYSGYPYIYKNEANPVGNYRPVVNPIRPI